MIVGPGGPKLPFVDGSIPSHGLDAKLGRQVLRQQEMGLRRQLVGAATVGPSDLDTGIHRLAHPRRNRYSVAALRLPSRIHAAEPVVSRAIEVSRDSRDVKQPAKLEGDPVMTPPAVTHIRGLRLVDSSNESPHHHARSDRMWWPVCPNDTLRHVCRKSIRFHRKLSDDVTDDRP